MPKIEVSYSDVCRLVGKKIDVKSLEEDMIFAKCEIDEHLEDNLKLDVKDTNRPDLWSAEGVAREIRYRYKGGFPEYRVKKSGVSVVVDKSVSEVRPFTACAVVRGLKITKNVLSQMVQLQEKVATTFGRNRRDVAIGFYDLHKIKLPIHYTTVAPAGIKFVPLDFEKELYPHEILEKHPKGKEFGHLLKGAARYPIFIDSAKNVLSIPPIINSAHTGKVTESTKDVFIECSGFDLRFLTAAINVMATALHERGGKVQTVDVVYGGKKITTPQLEPKKFSLDARHVNKISGLGLDSREIVRLLERSGYKASLKGKKLDVAYPAYRQDIMHASDVVEDIIITYGMNKIMPEDDRLPVTGKLSTKETVLSKISEIFIGAGFQEILSYTLTNKQDLFDKMSVSGSAAEIDNPMSSNWSVFRTWLLPSVMEFFSRNKHVEYPQKAFEIGTCIALDEFAETRSEDTTKLVAAVSGSMVSYEDVSSVLDVFMRHTGTKYSLKNHDHKSFVEGRCAAVTVKGEVAGFVGEIHPQVLNNWNLEKPVVAFELDLEFLLSKK